MLNEVVFEGEKLTECRQTEKTLVLLVKGYRESGSDIDFKRTWARSSGEESVYSNSMRSDRTENREMPGQTVGGIDLFPIHRSVST